MTTSDQIIEDVVHTEYRHGFVTEIESESLPPGLDEDVIRLISIRKHEPQFLLEGSGRLMNAANNTQRSAAHRGDHS